MEYPLIDAVCERHIVDIDLFREVLARIGDKWSLMVIGILNNRTLRFTELLNAVPGISQRMLTLTLRQLERDGLVIREVHAQVPPRVDYRMSDLGRTLIEPVTALAQWASEHEGEVRASRDAFDEAAER